MITGLIQHDVTARNEKKPVVALEKPVAPVSIVPADIVETLVTATSRDSIMALRRAGHLHGNSDQPAVFERRQLGAHFGEVIKSISAVIMPGPSGSSANICPHGSMIMLWPWVSKLLALLPN